MAAIFPTNILLGFSIKMETIAYNRFHEVNDSTMLQKVYVDQMTFTIINFMGIFLTDVLPLPFILFCELKQIQV